jgi:2,5-furandicarboxylate decarboxylase 1
LSDLRSFLRDHAAAVLRVEAPISVVHEITALQHALQDANRHPILHVPRPRSAAGADYAMPMVTNLTASRMLTAAALGIADHRRCAESFATRTATGLPPRVVTRDAAPVQEVILSGDEADLSALPALTQHLLEPGPYLTAAHATTFDPDSGIDNTAIQRCWVRGARRMSWFPYPSSHNARNLRKFWAKGERCPVAFWIGHHPTVLLGSQSKLEYPQSHWAAVGGLLGEPLAVVPTLTHGRAIMVPAEAEIVIEGWCASNVLEADGPFGEYTGYLGPQTQAPVVDVTCITRRRDAIYHDYGSGLTDMLVPDNITMEGKLFGMVRAVAPSLVNVHVPTSGRRFHAYLQFRNPARGEVRDGLAAALSYRRTKAVMAVDEDIDLFSSDEMLWALATRVQWSRDSFVVDGLSGSMLDPSLPDGAQTASKIAIDATLPPPPMAGAPRPVPARVEVPAAALIRARELLASLDSQAWPQS